MSEERMLILRMLSESKITPEEAEKLLRAIGGKKSTAEDAESSGVSYEEIVDGKAIAQAIGKVLGEVGNTVRDAVEQIRDSFVDATDVSESTEEVQVINISEEEEPACAAADKSATSEEPEAEKTGSGS